MDELLGYEEVKREQDILLDKFKSEYLNNPRFQKISSSKVESKDSNR